MDPTLVPGTRFESQFQICVYEHAILRIYINFFPTEYPSLIIQSHFHHEFSFNDFLFIKKKTKNN